MRRSVAQASTAVTRFATDEEAGVVDPPGPVRLDVGEDAVVDFLQLGRGGSGDVVRDRAHLGLFDMVRRWTRLQRG